MIESAAPDGLVNGPFFHRGDDGDRFWFFHPAHGTVDDHDAPPARGSILAVHAFAEELNKTRLAVADGARALAGAGYAVLQVDLAGCGDSAGDFADATWARWLADLDDAWRWLVARTAGPRWLWGTRFGALLADEFAGGCSPAADGLLLWQPVVNGAQHLGQFLRLKTVNGLLREGGAAATGGSAAGAAAGRVAPASSPRADLASGVPVEVAGYRLTPALADAMEHARLGARGGGADPTVPGATRPPAKVRWFDVSSQPSTGASPVAARVADGWRERGSDVEVATVLGNAFWQTIEMERCPALVDATVDALTA